jgi:hypothetical protein
MQNSSILPTSTVVSSASVANETAPTAAANISISNQKQHDTATTNNNDVVVVATEHELCLDELLKESYEKLMKASENESQLLPQIADNGSFVTHAAGHNNASSGMTFESDMAINSNYGHHIHNSYGGGTSFHSLETINEEDLLYGHVG